MLSASRRFSSWASHRAGEPCRGGLVGGAHTALYGAGWGGGGKGRTGRLLFGMLIFFGKLIS